MLNPRVVGLMEWEVMGELPEGLKMAIGEIGNCNGWSKCEWPSEVSSGKEKWCVKGL